MAQAQLASRAGGAQRYYLITANVMILLQHSPRRVQLLVRRKG
jgi:hypothetical protein